MELCSNDSLLKTRKANYYISHNDYLERLAQGYNPLIEMARQDIHSTLEG